MSHSSWGVAGVAGKDVGVAIGATGSSIVYVNPKTTKNTSKMALINIIMD